MTTVNGIEEKIRPFFQELAKKGELENFDAACWLMEGTTAFEFARMHLTGEEREELSMMAYAAILLEA